jgi:deazaflavin-dependent oxidoreductase (nitroreductase family)
MTPQRYVQPNWLTRNVFNKIVVGLTRIGISLWGSRILEVRGRKSAEPRRVPVNMLSVDGARYLVAPRGQTQWVRNLRVAGEGQFLVGRRRESFVASEIADADKEPILRAYLKRWKWEVGVFFGGVEPSSPSDDFQRIAPDHPVFRIETAPRRAS